MDLNFNIFNVIFMIPALLTAVIFHEIAHGYVAYKLGDSTAKEEGRLTVNPIPHIDPVGSLLVPGLLILVNSPFLFGWAKPVPINPYRFKVDYRKGIILTSLAGPLSNFTLAFIFSLLFHLLKSETFISLISSIASVSLIESIVIPLVIFFKYAVMVNLIIGIFNILPIPPLDGGNVVLNVLPRDIYEKILPYEQYGFFIVILLLMTGILGLVIYPIYNFFWNLMM